MAKNSPESLKRRNEKRRLFRQKADFNKIPKSITKICKDCGELGEHRFSGFTSRGLVEYRPICKLCQSKKESKQKKAKRKIINAQTVLRKNKRRNKLIEYKGGKCQSCGYCKSPRALTLHHRDPNEKEFEIASIIDHKWEKVIKEADKCDLLCFNCHMELHEKEDLKKLETVLGENYASSTSRKIAS